MNPFERYERYAGITFNQAADQYLEEFTGKCGDRQTYALLAVRPYIGHLTLIDVDDLALKQYKQDRIAIRMAGTVNKELMTVTAVLNKAARVWRYIPSAPMIQRVKGPEREPYPLSWAEQAKLFAHMKTNLRRICVFAVNTGVRRSEIFKLKWTDERDINGVNLFILRDTKNGKDRPVILNRLARRCVDSVRDLDDTFVFLKQSVSKPFNKAWVKAGLPDEWLIKKGIHNLRHTCGMRLRNAEVPPEDRDAILGHHNKSLTQHYAAPAIERLGEIVELITKPVDMAVLR
jgi:integrase